MRATNAMAFKLLSGHNAMCFRGRIHGDNSSVGIYIILRAVLAMHVVSTLNLNVFFGLNKNLFSNRYCVWQWRLIQVIEFFV